MISEFFFISGHTQLFYMQYDKSIYANGSRTRTSEIKDTTRDGKDQKHGKVGAKMKTSYLSEALIKSTVCNMKPEKGESKSSVKLFIFHFNLDV